MPSKQCLTYHWAHSSALRFLVTDGILERNRCIASDQEDGLYAPIRVAIRHHRYLCQSKHRLDQFHIFKKEWLNYVSIKFNDPTKKAIVS